MAKQSRSLLSPLALTGPAPSLPQAPRSSLLISSLLVSLLKISPRCGGLAESPGSGVQAASPGSPDPLPGWS